MLPGLGAGEPRWHEHCPQQDQPDPHGEVPEAAGHMSDPGEERAEPQSPPPAASLAEDEQRALELGGAWGQAPLLHVVEGKLGWWRLPQGHLGCCGWVSWEGLAVPVLTSPPHPAGVAAAGAGEERRARCGRRLHDLHEADRRWVPCARQ